VDAAVLYGGEVLTGSAIKETTHTCDIAMASYKEPHLATQNAACNRRY